MGHRGTEATWKTTVMLLAGAALAGCSLLKPAAGPEPGLARLARQPDAGRSRRYRRLRCRLSADRQYALS